MGGSDFPEYFKENGGSVISSTFDKYCYVTVRHLPRFFEYKDSIVYSKIERAKKVEDIEHPLVREAMKYLDMHELIVTYDADLPARTGLGTSSAFAVALLSAFHGMKGKYVDKDYLSREAIHLERDLCNEDGGWQDQIAASYGGFNRINFAGNDFTVTPILFPRGRKEQLEKNLMLYFTGFSRLSAEIQKDTKEALKKNASNLREMHSLVDQAQEILTNKHTNLDEIGYLLDHTWKLKRGITSKVSTEVIDQIYSEAISAGALGGKLLGAGGGGFLLFYVPQEKQELVRTKLKNLLYIPFRFEDTGAQIIYYKAEEYEVPIEYVD